MGAPDIDRMTDATRVLAMGLMVVGLAFASLLVGAVAQRFVATEVEPIELSEAELLDELRDVAARLARIELVLSRRA